MKTIRTEHTYTSITERWDAVDAYLECVTSCGLKDGVCVTMCITKHLEQETNTDDQKRWTGNTVKTSRRTFEVDQEAHNQLNASIGMKTIF